MSRQFSDIGATITAAAKVQDSATREIVRNMHEAVKGADNVANAIEGGRRTAGKRLLLVPKC